MLKIVFAIWFVLSIVLTIFGNFALLWFLSRKGVRTRFLWRGTPGYLDAFYINWCKENNKPYRLVMTLRWAFIFSLILAVTFFKQVMEMR
jgi:hypothetical protein